MKQFFTLGRVVFKDLRNALPPSRSLDVHLKETMEWLRRAHDADRDGGVSRSYALRWMRAHQRRGWLASYPETTGYIIPTFLNFAALSGDRDFSHRGIRMAFWEKDVQMANGAVQGGVVGFPPTPAIFNTGQVLFGWIRAYRESADESLKVAAQKAAEFLLEAQDSDGAWRRHASHYARSGVNVYDARTAWGVAEFYKLTGEAKYRDCAIKNLEFVLTQQHPNGWFANCCLDDNQNPLLHTIAYTMEGLLEGGLQLEEPRFVEAAQLSAQTLLSRQWKNGGLPGRFNSHWQGPQVWSCLTGNAQTAIVWFRLFELTGDRKFFEAGKRANQYIMKTQDIATTDPGIRGGIKGSHPIWAEYGTFEYLNWAAKFFADSLMLEWKLGKQLNSL